MFGHKLKSQTCLDTHTNNHNPTTIFYQKPPNPHHN